MIGKIFMCFCIALSIYFVANANNEVEVNYKHNLYREAKKLEAERDYHATKEQEHKQIKEVKKEEAIKKRGEYIGMEAPTSSAYKTAWEEYLFTKVEKTVDLPGFGDYQDLLASYAYSTCLRTEGITPTKNGWLYDCKTFVLVLNSENGGWNKDAKNDNTNGTRDGGIGQLNSQYHSDFINSERFLNPLSQIEYTLGVWKDASIKGRMPRYAYHPRFARDKGIKFLQ